jgi:hypothetical protein
VRRILWSEANIDHIARHGVTQDEAQDVCYGDSFGRRAGQGLYLLTGQTIGGRWLTVVLSSMGEGAYYVVTSRNATISERREAQRNSQ